MACITGREVSATGPPSRSGRASTRAVGSLARDGRHVHDSPRRPTTGSRPSTTTSPRAAASTSPARSRRPASSATSPRTATTTPPRRSRGRWRAASATSTRMLENAEIVEGGDGDGVVAAGSIVAIRYEGDDDVERYLRLHRGAARRPRRHLARLAARRGAARPQRRRHRRLRDARPAPARRSRSSRSRADRRGRRSRGLPSACRPAAPSTLPGRGTTFVRELPGPARRAHAPAAARLDRHRRPQLVRLLRAARPGTTGCVALDHRGHGRGIRTPAPLPPGRLRRRRRRARRRARHRPGHRRRLLDGRPDRPAALAPPPRQGRRPRAVRDDRPLRVRHPRGTGLARRHARRWPRMARLTPDVVLQTLSRRVLSAPRGRRPARRVGRGTRSPAATRARCSRRATAIGRFDARPWIGAIDVPTAVVLTERDNVVAPGRQRRLAAAIPGAEVFPVAGDHARLRGRRRPLRARAARRLRSVATAPARPA